MSKYLALFALLFAPFLHAQAGFQARADATTGGAISNHVTCSGNTCMPVDSRISTSTNAVGGNGLTSPAAVIFEHVNGRDFNISPDNGVLLFGGFQFGTGSLLSGSLSSVALFDVDQSYVTVGSNGSCGQFNLAGTCKAGGFTPNTNTLFVGVFVGRISWSTNPDNSHVVEGTVRGFVNGGNTVVFLNFVATTVPDASPFTNNGHLPIVSISLSPFA